MEHKKRDAIKNSTSKNSMGKNSTGDNAKHNQKFYVTTPIYYATAQPHLGTLYSTVLADIVARWQRLQAKDVFLLTGTDEFGQKVAQAAEKAGTSAQQFVDSFIDGYKDLWKQYEIDYRYFMRTTYDFHGKAVQQWILDLQKQGDIYRGEYTGWYCVSCETFMTEKDFQAGSQNPPCVTCERATDQVSESCYFFKLSQYTQKLLDFYRDNPDFITPKERMAEVIAFVKSGLQDLSISRTSTTWGVRFLQDPEHVTYVWADALNNYITAIGYGQKGREAEFKKWWPADVQVMGKDIVRFHAVYWPAFLMAARLPLPHRLLVHGWIKVGEHKMSKSRGNTIDPQSLYSTYGADEVRYYMARQLAITQDGQFSLEDLEQKITADLANDIGNLLQRMTMLAEKNSVREIEPGQWGQAEQELRAQMLEMIEQIEIEMARNYFHRALAILWQFIRQVNAYFQNQEPWKVSKIDKESFMRILSATCHSLHTIGLLAWPVMPKKMEKLLGCIGVRMGVSRGISENDGVELVNFIEQCKAPWVTTYVIGHRVEKNQDGTIKISEDISGTLFKKYETKKEVIVKAEVSGVQKQDESKSITQEIGIEDFAKVIMRVGTIIDCQEVPGSDKLLCLQVDFGDTKKQIFSGIKQSYTPEQLLNKQAIFVVNFKPRKIMGEVSEGMLITARDADGTLRLISPIVYVPNGSPLC